MAIQLGTYAIHRCEAGWAVLTLCDDPFEPATRVVAVVEEPKSLDLWLAATLRRIVREAGQKRRGTR